MIYRMQKGFKLLIHVVCLCIVSVLVNTILMDSSFFFLRDFFDNL